MPQPRTQALRKEPGYEVEYAFHQSRTLSLRSFWGRNERLWDNRSPEANLIGCLLEWNVVVKTKYL